MWFPDGAAVLTSGFWVVMVFIDPHYELLIEEHQHVILRVCTFKDLYHEGYDNADRGLHHYGRRSSRACTIKGQYHRRSGWLRVFTTSTVCIVEGHDDQEFVLLGVSIIKTTCNIKSLYHQWLGLSKILIIQPLIAKKLWLPLKWWTS